MRKGGKYERDRKMWFLIIILKEEGGKYGRSNVWSNNVWEFFRINEWYYL